MQHPDPILRFSEWLARARGVDRAIIPEPTAFALATVSSAGRPSVRMLLLKDANQDGFAFYTNLRSAKGADLAANPVAAMCFHWAPLELQVRVEGMVFPVGDTEADSYFASRPRASQIGAWASDQSALLPDRGELERRVSDLEERFAAGPVPRPPHWSGFRLRPDAVEFWQGRPSRLHIRELYTRSPGGWEVFTLYP